MKDGIKTKDGKKYQYKLNKANLNELPMKSGIFALFEKSCTTEDPYLCLNVNTANNIGESIKSLFSNEKDDELLSEHLNSEQLKLLIYEIVPESDKRDLIRKEDEWINIYRPVF